MENQNDGKDSYERHIITPVANGKTAEKSKIKKAIGIFIAEDAYDMKDHIVDEYIAPRAKSFGMELVRKLKEFILDSIVDIARTMLWGDSRKNSSGSYGDYTRYYDGSKVYKTYVNNSDPYDGPSYRYVSSTTDDNATRLATDIVPLDLNSIEVERVRGGLIALEKKFEFVPISDYYQLCGRSDLCRKEENNFGWPKGSFSEGIRTVAGTKKFTYQLVLPRPVARQR